MSSCPEDQEIEAQKIMKRRQGMVRDEIRNLLRRFSLIVMINDEGILAVVDAACKIDRRAIFVEEAKRLIQEMETHDANTLQASWGIETPIEGNEKGSRL